MNLVQVEDTSKNEFRALSMAVTASQNRFFMPNIPAEMINSRLFHYASITAKKTTPVVQLESVEDRLF